MQVYNTLGRAVQPFTPLNEDAVGIYVCGPTVQSAPHLGHGRFMVAFDAIRRYLTWRGYTVTYVQNVTDVDDKIINAANERGIEASELAVEMAHRFRGSATELAVLPPDVEPKATEHVPDMIVIIEQLIRKGLAYPSDGDVYFRVRQLEGYGKLSGINIDELRAGARIEAGEEKEDPADFALWKAAKPGEPSWDSPWGPGRPGWHIECSAMAARYLGTTFDIHAGGNDLIFPHHENEIAQSEGASGQPFATYWLHNGMVNLGGEKMSKSTGRLIDLEEAIATYGGPAVRLFYLRAHYRSPLEFSVELLEDAVASLDRLKAFRRRAGAPDVGADEGAVRRFTDAMDDDFNTPIAIAVLFDVVRDGNRALDTGESAGEWVAAFDEMVEILGLDLEESGVDDLGEQLAVLAAELGVSGVTDTDAVMAALIERRRNAREAKDWATADAIRDGLGALGISIEDGTGGTTWHRS